MGRLGSRQRQLKLARSKRGTIASASANEQRAVVLDFQPESLDSDDDFIILDG